MDFRHSSSDLHGPKKGYFLPFEVDFQSEFSPILFTWFLQSEPQSTTSSVQKAKVKNFWFFSIQRKFNNPKLLR